MVSKTIDFPNMEPELLVSLIQCNDLVIEDEFKLFECISRWLSAKKLIMETSGEDNIELHFDRYVNLLMPHVRFPMMTPHQLVDLLLNPLSQSHTHLIVDRIRAGLSYHKGQIPDDTAAGTCNLFTPRLYTTEKYCASLSVDHFYELPTYHSRSLVFTSQKHISEHLGDDQLDWNVDVYPKGVWFQRCLTVYMPPGKEVPERVMRTVRVSVTTKEVELTRVKIGILVVGNQDNFEHVRCVKARNFIFTPQDQIVNFDDIVDHDELITQKPKSHFLSGEHRETFKILVTITPMSSMSSLTIS